MKKHFYWGLLFYIIGLIGLSIYCFVNPNTDGLIMSCTSLIFGKIEISLDEILNK